MDVGNNLEPESTYEMTNSFYLKLLESGKDAWNQWRTENSEIIPDLEESTLINKEFGGYNLRNVNLRKASLQGSNFTNADLTSANLERTHLSGADFSNAVLDYANLNNSVVGNPEIKKSDFWRIERYEGDDLVNVKWAPLENDETMHFSEFVRYSDIPDKEFEKWRQHIMGTLNEDNYNPAIFKNANLKSANLEKLIADKSDFSNANLKRSNLFNSRLQLAIFHSADLTHSDLRKADFAGADIFEATLGSADLRGVRNITLDSNYIRDARFDPNSKDTWSLLRRKYSGFRMFLTLLALTVFFTPYLLRALYYQIMFLIDQEYGTELHKTTELMSAPIYWESKSLISMVLQWNQSWQVTVFNTLLIIYNVSRGILTLFIGPLRSEEERSGYSQPLHRVSIPEVGNADWRPLLKKGGILNVFWTLFLKLPLLVLKTRPFTYGWLIPIDRLVKFLYYLAIISLAISVFDWITAEIRIPSFK